MHPHRRLKTVYWRRRLTASLAAVAIGLPSIAFSAIAYVKYVGGATNAGAAVSTTVDSYLTLNPSGTGSTYFQAAGDVIPNTNTFSVEMWVYDTQDSESGFTEFISQGAAGVSTYIGTSGSSQRLRAGDGWLDTGYDLPTNQWVHLALTVSSGSATLYANGVSVATSSGYPAPGSGSPFRVGEQWCAGGVCNEPMHGHIDEIRVWSDVRSAAEIQAGMHAKVGATGVPSDNLAAYWDMNQTVASTITAVGGSSSNSTLSVVNGPAVFTQLAPANTDLRSGYTVHTFTRSYITQSGGWTVPYGVAPAAEVLVVGGGGGGGSHVGGGGGGGGARTATPTLTSGTNLTVTVGMGGRGGRTIGPNGGWTEPTNGQSSTFSTTTSFGGGRGAGVFWGAASVANGDAVATGGGGSCCTTANATGGTGTAGQGFAGGTTSTYAQPHATGGGGGAGAVGGAGSQPTPATSVSGNGGNGLPSSITGTSTYYGGGGGGSAHGVTNSNPYVPGDPGEGGLGGGGNGSVPTQANHLTGTIVAQSGSANTGGGGGGSAAQYDGNCCGATVRSIGGDGGSGVVILAYRAGTCTETSPTSVTIGGIAYQYVRWTTPDTVSGDGTHNGDAKCYDSFTVPNGVTSLDVLVVAGGGGGGFSQGSFTAGGGGGGGVIYDTVAVTAGASLQVEVGAGGAGATSSDTTAPNGGNSVLGSNTAVGGGGGGSRYYAGANGGSGGGGGSNSNISANNLGGQTCASPSIGNAGGTGTATQGNDASYRGCDGWGGSGGGAGSPSYISGTRATAAGLPLSVSITGSTLNVGAGGHAGFWADGSDPSAGSGGGGRSTYGATAPYSSGNGRAGASGTVIVRWAVSSADELSNIDLFARYRAGDYNATNKVWADSSGNGRHVNSVTGTVTGTPTLTTAGGNGNGAGATFPVVSGTASATNTAIDWIEFPTEVLPADYTMHHIARYATGAVETERIFNSRDPINYLSGFWASKSGVAYQKTASDISGWITQYTTTVHGSDWVLSTDAETTATATPVYRSQGVDRTTCGLCSGVNVSSPRLSINQGSYAEYSDWQVADILVYSSRLTAEQMRQNELYLNRLYGISTPGLQATAVTAAKVAASSSSLAVTWARATDVTPTAQTLQVSTDATNWSTATTAAAITGTSTSATVTGLTGGTSYYFRVVTDLPSITNETLSAVSAAVAPYISTTTTLTNSASPTENSPVTLTATLSPGMSAGTVAFTADGTTITGCGAKSVSGGVATCTWTPTAAATYSVVATYTEGTVYLGSNDTESIVVIADTPGAPSGLSADGHGPGRLDVSWTAPSGNITDYVVEYSPAGTNTWTTFADGVSTTTSTTITDLSADTRYDVRVSAKNGSLTGPTSNVVSAWTHIVIVSTFTTPGTHTWRSPRDADLIELLLVGGGGGGAAGRALNSSSWYGGGGGGEGGSTSRSSRAVSPDADHTVTVGAGGNAGTTNGANGGLGGSSSFDGVVSAAGGAAGGASTALNTGGLGGSGGNGADGGRGAVGSGGALSTASAPTNGGSASSIDFYGTSLCVSGGGGGGQRGSESNSYSFAGSGGACGATRSGGKGNYYDHASTRTYIAAQTGVDGTGGGGGGGAYTSGTAYRGAAGGSGLVAVAVAVPLLITSGTSGGATFATAYTSTTPVVNGRNSPFVWSATGLPAWASVNASTGVITGTPNSVGTSSVTLRVTDASGDYDEESVSLSVAIANQSLTFTYSGNKTYGDADFNVQATASSGLVVSFTTDTPSVCSVTGDTTTTAGSTGAVVSTLKSGTCNLTAAQAGNTGWNAATSVTRSFTVAKANQSALSLVSSTTVTYGDTVTLGTSGGSGSGAVTYSLVGGAGTAGCIITSGVVSFTSAGTCVVRAAKATDDRYVATDTSDVTITVSKAAQSISFTSSVPATPTAGGTYALTAAATSSLTPAFSIVAGAGTACSISGATVTFIASGRCEVAADQAGDDRYSPATQVKQVIAVGQRNQNIAFAQPADVDFGDADFSLGISASSGLAVTVTSETTTVCTVVGDVVSVVAVGDCTVKAAQAGNATWAAASDVTRTFRVRAAVPTAPTITSISAANEAVTLAFTSPSFTGGAAISGYRVVVAPTTGTALTFDTCTTSPCTVEGLTNGTEYSATVAARNIAGIGAASSASPLVTPVTRATAPTAIAAVPGAGTLAVTWSEPETLGGGTFVEYQLRIRVRGESWPSNASATIVASSTVSHTFTGLADGVEYEVQIVTVTSANATPFVGNTGEMSAVPVSVPSEPRDVAAVETTRGGVRVAWSEPLRNGGAPVTAYQVTFDNGATCGTVSISSTTRTGFCEATGLASGMKYAIGVSAVNRVGAGSAVTTSFTVPSADTPSVGGAAPQATTTPADTPSAGGATPQTTKTRTTPQATTSGRTATPKSGRVVNVSTSGVVTAVKAKRQPTGVTAYLGAASINISAATGSGVYTNGAGQLVVHLPGSVLVTAKGLAPGTTATVWMMSRAVKLGVATVGKDGTIRRTFSLPSSLAAGQHTIQVETTANGGEPIALAFGLSATRAEVPVTGNDPFAPFAAALAMVFLGGLLLWAGPRRRRLA